MKIVCFGDSLTWGGYGGDYVSELAALMPEHTFINAGQGGNTVVNLLRRFEADVLSHEPDGVFIMIGGNDAISYHNPGVRPYFIKVQHIPEGLVTPEQFESTYRELLTQMQLHHLITWVGLEPTEYSHAAVKAMADYNTRAVNAARAVNVPTLDLPAALVDSKVLQDRPAFTMDFILTIGQREKRGWDDYDSVRVRDGFTYTFDGVHVTPEGAKRMAALIAAFIRANS